LAYWLRFETPLRKVGIEAADAHYYDYLPLIYLGTLFFIGSFSALAAYDKRLLLRPHRGLSILMRGVFFWVLTFLGVSLALKFEPAISRLFVLFSSATTLAFLSLWRWAFHESVSRSRLRDDLAQTVIILGWSKEATRLIEAIQVDQNHPYDVRGFVSSHRAAETPLKHLGNLEQIEAVLQNQHPNILVVADLDLSREELVQVAAVCERHYVEFKVIPSFFQIFVSGLRLQSISGISILGIEALPLDSLPNQLIKRSIDFVGGLIGLVGSLPIMAMLAFLVWRESPGPVIYRQVRTGLHGRPFTIYKMRSMRLDAEAQSGARWAVKDDPRRLRIGAFMREWNLDELPQFWNVLRGDMSLVGPRPERPELIAEFEKEIPHYNPRHSVRPGLSGWAQINGLRGDTSLVDRVKYDLYYIENWSIWFDLQIMLLTFFRRKNAY
jgi:exopolysaccharide biosynthesis polyprenyl glycosylphosphotransferase